MRNVATGTEVEEAAAKAEEAPREVGREASKASQRPRMIEALIELVAEHGYAGTSIREIARVAGVSLSTFYEHFDDKEECFLVAYDQVADKLLEDIGAVTLQSRTPRAALLAGIEVYFTSLAAQPAAAATFVVEVHTAGPAALARRAEIHRRYQELVALAPKAAAQRRRAPRGRPDGAVAAVTSTMDAMTHDYVRQGRTGELPSLIPAAQELALHILRL
jgi:AcrR family transcriptional regulator